MRKTLPAKLKPRTKAAVLEAAVANIDQYKSAAQTEIRFRPGQTALSKQAKDALDELVAQLKEQRGYICLAVLPLNLGAPRAMSHSREWLQQRSYRASFFSKLISTRVWLVPLPSVTLPKPIA